MSHKYLMIVAIIIILYINQSLRENMMRSVQNGLEVQ